MASQIFDNRYIWGHRHLYSAIWHAINAEINQSKIANSLSMEILLYAAGHRQIKKAIEFLGIKNTTKEIVGVLIGQNKQQLMDAELELNDYFHFQPNLDLIDDFSSKIKFILEMLTKEGYSVKDYSILDIEKVIFQRIALLALES